MKNKSKTSGVAAPGRLSATSHVQSCATSTLTDRIVFLAVPRQKRIIVLDDTSSSSPSSDKCPEPLRDDTSPAFSHLRIRKTLATIGGFELVQSSRVLMQPQDAFEEEEDDGDP